MSARDPQELEPRLIGRAHASDIDGMVALYEPDAVIALGAGEFARGTREIHRYFTALLASGFVFEEGIQYPAVRMGDLALTSSRYPNGTISAEVARQQEEGHWLWILDYPTVGD